MNESERLNLFSILQPDRFGVPPWRPISSRKLAAMLGVSLQSLANWRVRGTGPDAEPQKKGRGNRIFYRPDKVIAWLSCGQTEDWLVCEAWLRERDIEVTPAGRDAVYWMAASLDMMMQ